jgi:GT2 family glycosyltransferase
MNTTDGVPISIIIPTINRGFACYNAVLSLLAGTRLPDEILVVDQTPREEQNSVLWPDMQKLYANPRVRHVKINKASLVHARNVGAAQAKGDVLIFIDDDVFLPADFVDRYAELFADGQLAAATGLVLVSERDDGTFKPLSQTISSPGHSNMLRGGNFAIRKEAWKVVGGMDEQFQGACQHEDWDLAVRLEGKGLRVIWDPGPWIYHLNLAGGGRRDHRRRLWDAIYNVAYFGLRHPRWQSGRACFWELIRSHVLCRATLRAPWQIPFRLATTVRAWREARRAVKRGPLLQSEEKGGGSDVRDR